MKIHTVITPESLLNILKCFVNIEEAHKFVNDLDTMSGEVKFQTELMERSEEDEFSKIIVTQICVFALFFREHAELIHQILSKLDIKEVTEEEFNKMKKITWD